MRKLGVKNPEQHNAVLDLWVSGNRTGDIARTLGVSKNVIDHHIRRARDNLDPRAVRRQAYRSKLPFIGEDAEPVNERDPMLGYREQDERFVMAMIAAFDSGALIRAEDEGLVRDPRVWNPSPSQDHSVCRVIRPEYQQSLTGSHF